MAVVLSSVGLGACCVLNGSVHMAWGRRCWGLGRGGFRWAWSKSLAEVLCQLAEGFGQMAEVFGQVAEDLKCDFGWR